MLSSVKWHPDCHITSSYSTKYDADALDVLVSGYNRLESKKYFIPSEIYVVILQFLPAISFKLEANEKNLSKHFITRTIDYSADIGTICILTNYPLPYQIISGYTPNYPNYYGAEIMVLKVRSPFAMQPTKTEEIEMYTNSVECVHSERKRYLISHFEEDSNDLVCLDENYEEVYWKLSKDRVDIYEKAQKMMKESEELDEDIYAVILKTYARDGVWVRNSTNYSILQILIDVVMPSKECEQGKKSQSDRPFV